MNNQLNFGEKLNLKDNDIPDIVMKLDDQDFIFDSKAYQWKIVFKQNEQGQNAEKQKKQNIKDFKKYLKENQQLQKQIEERIQSIQQLEILIKKSEKSNEEKSNEYVITHLDALRIKQARDELTRMKQNMN